jgi:hypothetical protein
MSFTNIDLTPPTPVYPCIGGPQSTATDSSVQLNTLITGTVYEYKQAYEATGKKYKFKTQQERMAYILESIKSNRCN